MGGGERRGREGPAPWAKRRVRIPKGFETNQHRARAIDIDEQQQPSPKQFKNATEKTPGGARATTAYRADAVHTTPSVR